MKRRNMKNLLAAAFVLTAVLSVQACAQSNAAALLIKQAPENGGTVSPAIGVTNYELNQTVKVSATPRPGYQFVYWIGDVADPTSTTTVAHLDSPKVLIAVFERVKHDNLSSVAGPTSTPYQNLRPSARDIVAHSNSPVAGKRPHKYYPPTPPENINTDLPVPEDDEFNDRLPVPENQVPEPATLLLTGLGSLIALRKKNRKK